jgi:hypothetical protein
VIRKRKREKERVANEIKLFYIEDEYKSGLSRNELADFIVAFGTFGFQ